MYSQTETINKRTRSSDPAISVKMGEKIGMNKTITQVLSNPAHFNFLWGERGKVLAISAADAPTDMSIPIPGFFYSTRNGSKIRNWKLMKAIKTLTGWNDGSVHLLVGEFIPELNIIVFQTNGEEKESKDNV